MITNQQELDHAWNELLIHHDDKERCVEIEKEIQVYIDEKNRINRAKYLENGR